MKFNLHQCKNLSSFLTESNKKIQNYRQFHGFEALCWACNNIINNPLATNGHRCSIGGFRVKPKWVCDLFEEKKL